MVGYVLGNTMSHSGSVSRGVCTVENGYLKSINENKNIYYQGEKIITEAPDGSKKEFTGKEWVSMNLFGFSQRVLDDFQPYWENFIATKADTEKEECLLPIAVGHMLEHNYGKVKFFSSSENWFGMTYTEDRQIVRNEIAKKVEKGYYPERLY